VVQQHRLGTDPPDGEQVGHVGERRREVQRGAATVPQACGDQRLLLVEDQSA
jgi:hypothetical protein